MQIIAFLFLLKFKIVKDKKLFKQPYGYIESFILGGIFVILGFIVEIITPAHGLVFPKSPTNIYILLILILFIIFIQIFLTKYYFFKWLSSVPVAISTISWTTFLVLIMAIVPQKVDIFDGFMEKFGFTYMSENWAMIFITFLLLISLGLITIKRAKPFNKKNFGFLLNHLGLWIVIASASIGSGEQIRLKMYVTENANPVWQASDKNNMYDLSIAIKLIDFELEQYNPEIALIDNSTGDVVIDKKNKVFLIEKGDEYRLNNMTIKIDDFVPLSVYIDGNYVVFFDEGAVPAAKISVFDKDENLITTSWISCGSKLMNPNILKIDSLYSIALLEPQPKKYSSELELFAKDGTTEKVTIEVNKPYTFKGWKIYQISYDESMGRWSETSVLELVRDPWLPVVYLGLFMILAGVVYIFWFGKYRNN